VSQIDRRSFTSSTPALSGTHPGLDDLSRTSSRPFTFEQDPAQPKSQESDVRERAGERSVPMSNCRGIDTLFGRGFGEFVVTTLRGPLCPGCCLLQAGP
jgi:hypothetical protein